MDASHGQATRSLSAFFTKTNAEHQEDGIVTEDRVGDLSASKLEDVGMVTDVMSAKQLNGDLKSAYNMFAIVSAYFFLYCCTLRISAYCVLNQSREIPWLCQT